MNYELYHYGVPGMKWGVRKARYKAMTSEQKRAVLKKYYKTADGKRNLKYTAGSTVIDTVLGGPLVGIGAGLITNSIMASRTTDLRGTKQTAAGKKAVDKMLG